MLPFLLTATFRGQPTTRPQASKSGPSGPNTPKAQKSPKMRDFMQPDKKRAKIRASGEKKYQASDRLQGGFTALGPVEQPGQELQEQTSYHQRQKQIRNPSTAEKPPAENQEQQKPADTHRRHLFCH